MTGPIAFRLNGRPVTVPSREGAMLLGELRTGLELTGTKYGCGEGLCGACTVLVDNRPVRACTTPLERVAGREVTTIEGLAQGGRLHPLQQAFIDEGAFQCGYCTPGMLLAAHALLRENANPSAAEIAKRLDGHLCRCGAHQRVIAAVQGAARVLRGRS